MHAKKKKKAESNGTITSHQTHAKTSAFIFIPNSPFMLLTFY